MRLIGLMPSYQRPDTSRMAKGRKSYRYLLRMLRVERPNQSLPRTSDRVGGGLRADAELIPEHAKINEGLRNDVESARASEALSRKGGEGGGGDIFLGTTLCTVEKCSWFVPGFPV